MAEQSDRWRNALTNPEFAKNWHREAPVFANVNLLGACNVNCYFCLGKDIEGRWKGAPMSQHFSEWPNFEDFLGKCKVAGIQRIYVTGQNTDSLLYQHLDPLIDELQNRGFGVGLRTNGYLAERMLPTLNKCERNVGFSIHSLKPEANWEIMRRRDLPDWGKIVPAVRNVRISIVLNRHNRAELFDLLKFTGSFPNVKYVQVRRICTDTREEYLLPDVRAYEEEFAQVRQDFAQVGTFYGAEVFQMFGKEVCWWRTVKTTIESFNYYTDGTINDEYFVIEGYMRESQNYPRQDGVPQKSAGLEGYWRDERKRVRLAVLKD